MATGKVAKVIDGDTFQLRSGGLVRLAGVKAPETGRPGAQAAKQVLQKLVPPGTVVGIAQKAKSYGRVVGDVTNGGRSVNKAMQRKGYK